MNTLIALLRKEIATEFRTFETSVVLVFLSLLLAVISAFGISGAFLDPKTRIIIAPVFIWIIFIFSSTNAFSRIFDADLEFGGLQGLLASGARCELIYLAKVLVLTGLTWAAQLIASAALILLANVEVPLLSVLGPLSLISLLAAFGFSALTTLLAGVAATSRLKTLLLPLLLLPLIFPLFFCGLELTNEIFTGEQMTSCSSWFSLLLMLDIVYLILGLNLFEYVIYE